MASSSHADTTIGICAGTVPGGRPFISSDGTPETLVVGEVNADCESLELKVDREAILWADTVPFSETLERVVTLVGSFRRDAVSVGRIEFSDAPVPDVASNASPVWSTRPYGVRRAGERLRRFVNLAGPLPFRPETGRNSGRGSQEPDVGATFAHILSFVRSRGNRRQQPRRGFPGASHSSRIENVRKRFDRISPGREPYRFMPGGR